MAWRDKLTEQERQVVDSAAAGSLIRRLADLLDQMESPRQMRYEPSGRYIPPNLVRLDE